MFLSENIPALFKKGTLKLQEGEDGYVRVAEATCLIEPFPVNLARELGEDIAGHLFTTDDAIREELESIDLRVRAGLQNVLVRPNEALEPIARLSPVSIKDVTAAVVEDKKSQRRWLSFSFVLVFSLETKEARNFVLDQFGRTLLWSFEGIQRDLLDKASLYDALAKLGDPDGTGQTTVSFGVRGEEMTEIKPEKHRAEARRLRDQAKAH